MKRNTLVLLGFSAALLASCGGSKDTPAPATQPIVGKAQDMAQLPSLQLTASSTVQSMTSPGADQQPELTALLNLLKGTGFMGVQAVQPTQYGQALVNSLTHQGGLHAQALGDLPLPTGTFTTKADGTPAYRPEPTTGLVIINEQEGTRLDVNWHVDGAPSAYIMRNAINTQEVPTKAYGVATRGTAKIAEVTFGMTPGDCLQLRGPTALTLSGWGGQQANPAAQVNLNYAWTDAGITSSGSAKLQTKTRSASGSFSFNLSGTTANRCAPLQFAFTPSSMTASASTTLPDQQAEGSLNITDIGNVVLTADPTRLANPFKGVTGTLSASAKYNGQVALTAAGPIADGNDFDLLPGDQVKVQYVKNGVLVEKTLPEALKDLLGK